MLSRFPLAGLIHADHVVHRNQGGLLPGQQLARGHPANPVLALQQTPNAIRRPAIFNQFLCFIVPQQHPGRNLIEERRRFFDKHPFEEIERNQ